MPHGVPDHLVAACSALWRSPSRSTDGCVSAEDEVSLLKNLLENAIQHAPAGTAVTVDIRSDALTVRDCGPGVDAAQLPLLFERFWRGAHRRDHGAGLGLAICQEIALAHEWHLSAERAEPGLQFRLALAGHKLRTGHA